VAVHLVGRRIFRVVRHAHEESECGKERFSCCPGALDGTKELRGDCNIAGKFVRPQLLSAIDPGGTDGDGLTHWATAEIAEPIKERSVDYRPADGRACDLL
jgi:hypothetical protein